MKLSRVWMAAVLVCASLAAQAQSKANLNARLTAATTVIRQIMATPDKGVPMEIAGGATCVGVIPGLKKAAFVVGGSYGQGVATCRNGSRWSAPVFIRLAGGSFGFQLGAQSTDLVLIAVNDQGFQDLLKSKFKIGADASAAAGPVGRHASASTDWKLNAQLLTYSRSKGLFAGIDLNGAVVSQNTDDTKAFYGGDSKSFEQILKGNAATPASARPFVATVARYFRAAKAR